MQTRDMQYWQKRWDDFVVVTTNVTSRADLLEEMKKAGGARCQPI